MFVLVACGEVTDPSDPNNGGTGGTVTYTEHIAPLVQDKCLRCHNEAGIAPFALSTYEETIDVADIMKHVTENRIMPPFLPDNSGDCNTYKTNRWLTQAEIDMIGDWVDNDSPRGGSTTALVLGENPGLNDKTHSVLMDEPYSPNPLFDDDYRCFILDPQLDTDQFLTAFGVNPGNGKTVHHVIAFGLKSAAQDAEAQALDDAEAGPGYTCFGDSGVGSVNSLTDVPTIAVAWAPGEGVTHYPEGTGILLKAGRKLVMQVHYNLAGGTASDLTTLDFKMVPAEGSELERGAVIGMFDTDLNIPGGVKEHAETFTFDLTQLGVFGGIPIDVHMVFPHMHELGKSLRSEIIQNGETKCLTDVPRWDFNWQGYYEFEEAVRFTTSDSLKITCNYDSRGREGSTHWGEGTQDEMCINAMYVTSSLTGFLP